MWGYTNGVVQTHENQKIFYFKIMNLGWFSMSFVILLFNPNLTPVFKYFSVIAARIFIISLLFFFFLIYKISLFMQSEASRSRAFKTFLLILWNTTCYTDCYKRFTSVSQRWFLIANQWGQNPFKQMNYCTIFYKSYSPSWPVFFG